MSVKRGRREENDGEEGREGGREGAQRHSARIACRGGLRGRGFGLSLRIAYGKESQVCNTKLMHVNTAASETATAIRATFCACGEP